MEYAREAINLIVIEVYAAHDQPAAFFIQGFTRKALK
jgi:hypothetical protein